MKIFSADQIRQWDAYTIRNTPIASIELMERAARACFEELKDRLSTDDRIAVFCGSGNNGGDGLALARMFSEAGYPVVVYLLSAKTGSEDYGKNLDRYKEVHAPVFLKEDQVLPELGKNEIVIDAIFGTGLNKPVEGFYGKVIAHINAYRRFTISIDVPSGMFTDRSSTGSSVIRADMTLTFQAPKLAFFMPENSLFIGRVKILNIGLSAGFAGQTKVQYQTNPMPVIPARSGFSHKGDFGNACLIAGSYGMMGAAVLAARGCLRSGVGKLTCISCEKGYDILQITAPEAMCLTSGEAYIRDVFDLEKYTVIGVGPGLGVHESHVQLLRGIFNLKKPMVIDADALNVLSGHPELYDNIPVGSILTPHPKEFARLFGKTGNDFEERELALSMAEKYRIYIVLKGHRTLIATPDDGGFFNETGNAGMATGGSGDVLCGIITGLLAQGLEPGEACKSGVYIHGMAGDLAAGELSENGLKASDICDYLGKAFIRIQEKAE